MKLSLRFYRLAAALIAIATNLPAAQADVLPPGYREARERFENTVAWDREDQFCAGKKADAACRIPGNPFEGGGDGRCTRKLPRGATHIDLGCELSVQPEIRRDIPVGPYLAEADTCELIAKGSIKPFAEFVCTPPPPVADRFCAGLKEGDACQAEVGLDKTTASFAGICLVRSEQKNYYQYGYRVASRDVLQCRPQAPAPAKAFTPVGVVRKLAQ